MASLTIIALAVIVFVIYYYFSRKKDGYPPGPTGVPLVGNLLSVGNRPHLKFDEWAKKYGPIFSINFGLNPRPNSSSFSLLAGGKFGVISADGETWVEQRRFTLRNLRDFGFGRNSMEATVMEEVQTVLTWMKKEEGQPITLDRKFSLSVLNALWNIMTGERYDHDDAELNHILESGNKTFNEGMETGIPIFFPELAELFPKVTGWQKFVAVVDSFRNTFDAAVRQHEENPAPEGQPRDFIDAYLNEIKKTTDPSSSFYKEKGRKSLVAVVGDLHGAGSETTSQTLTWTILYLIRHPEIQKKLHKEIDEVIGSNRLPSLTDRPKMPYMEALLMEILRFFTLVPFGVFHNTMTDVEFHGYKIPKDTMIIVNHYSAHFSKEAWGDLEKFRPERFLSPDGKTIVRNDSLIPFAVGKRACLGETLARDELFLFITSIFQKFDIRADPANPKPTMEPKVGFLQTAHPFTVVMTDQLA